LPAAAVVILVLAVMVFAILKIKTASEVKRGLLRAKELIEKANYSLARDELIAVLQRDEENAQAKKLLRKVNDELERLEAEKKKQLDEAERNLSVLTSPALDDYQRKVESEKYRKKALEDLKKAVELAEEGGTKIDKRQRLQLDFARAMSLVLGMQYEKCIGFCDKKVSEYGEDYLGVEQFIWLKGACLCTIGNYNEAEEILSLAITKRPNYARVFCWRGGLRYAKGNIEEAIADFSQAIRINPNYALAYYNRGVARYEKGDIEGAIADIKQALTVAPPHWPHRSLVEKTLRELRRELAEKKNSPPR
jgi:tetratricopeptide (TPR) repeat protein